MSRLLFFVSIWVMVILGAVFNAPITQPIKELLVGVKHCCWEFQAAN